MIVHNIEDASIAEIIDTGCWIRSISYNKDGSRLAVGSDDMKCKIFETTDWEWLHEIRHPAGVTSVQFTEDNGLVTGCADNNIRIFDTNYY